MTLRTLILALVLLSIAYGLWFRGAKGRFSAKKSQKSSPKTRMTEQQIGHEFGRRVTLVQFSSAFCTPCRATRILLREIAGPLDDVEYVEIDAESNLELVRTLKIHSTPTTLILDRDGNEVGRAVGAPRREHVIQALAAVH